MRGAPICRGWWPTVASCSYRRSRCPTWARTSWRWRPRQVADWPARYGGTPLLLETFVDDSRYAGTVYRAANWQRLRATASRGRQDCGGRDPSRRRARRPPNGCCSPPFPPTPGRRPANGCSGMPRAGRSRSFTLFSSVDFDRTAVSSVRERACIRTGGSPNG
jgi:hypothetical protein